MPSSVTTSIGNWNFNEFHVQLELNSGEFINAYSTLIAAGPPTLEQATGNGGITQQGNSETNAVAFPIGVVENFAAAQNKQLQRLFEIGSRRSYFIPGRVVGSIQIARTIFHGPSLLRVLYAFYPATKFPAGTNSQTLLRTGAGLANAFLPTIRSRPGFVDAFFDLDSDLFDQAFGMLVLMRDNTNSPYAGMYFEDCHLRAHQYSVNASSALIAEGVTADFDRAIPVDVNAQPRVPKVTTG